MAAGLALEHNERKAAVLGCGSPGLTAARQLQRRGFEVTIYYRHRLPRHHIQHVLGWFHARHCADQQPAAHTGLGSAIPDPNAPRPQAGPPTPGSREDDLLPEYMQPERVREVLGPGEHPFPSNYAVRTSSLAIEPSIYLDKLVADFVLFGGKTVIRKFDTPRDMLSLPESIVVNCTGPGSKALFNDHELVPIKGQLTVCIPQPEVKYRAFGRLPESTVAASINPRSDGIVIGNMMERGTWSLDPNPEVRQQNVDAAIHFFAAMRAPSIQPSHT